MIIKIESKPFIDVIFAIKNNTSSIIDSPDHFVNKLINNYNLPSVDIKELINNKSNDYIINQIRKEVVANSPFLSWYRLEIDIAIKEIKKLLKEADFLNAELIKNLLIKSKIVLVPCLFMDPAPYGKLSVDLSDDEELSFIIFIGFSQFMKEKKEFFVDWLKIGVWHSILRCYLNRFNHTINNLSVEQLIGKYFDKQTKFHSEISLYIKQHILFASKILLLTPEYNKITNEEKSQLLNDSISKGYFHMNWFLDKIASQSSLNDFLVNSIFSEWNIKPPSTKIMFAGRLQSCAYNFWKRNIRVVFSSTIPKTSRSKLLLHLKLTFKSSFIVQELDDLNTNSWSNYCNIVFCTNNEILKLCNILNEGNEILEMIDDNDAFIYIKKNTNQETYWTRICLGLDENHLLKISYQASKTDDADWLLLKNGRLDGGYISYKNGCLTFKKAKIKSIIYNF